MEELKSFYKDNTSLALLVLFCIFVLLPFGIYKEYQQAVLLYNNEPIIFWITVGWVTVFLIIGLIMLFKARSIDK
ncbi:MAG: hypothetical protein ACI88L_000141 [Candidatus Paceibacteria bacterium]|jgi:hypothetical protein